MGKRPIGISILAVLHLIGGVALAGLSLSLAANFEMMSKVFDMVGIPPALFVSAFVLLAVLFFASGIGMWRGARWGWWLGAANYPYAVARAASGLLFLYRFGADFGGEGGLSAADYRKLGIKFSGRIVVSSLIFLYFFKSNVLAYFGLVQLSKAKAAGILIAATVAVAGLTTAITWLAQ